MPRGRPKQKSFTEQFLEAMNNEEFKKAIAQIANPAALIKETNTEEESQIDDQIVDLTSPKGLNPDGIIDFTKNKTKSKDGGKLVVAANFEKPKKIKFFDDPKHGQAEKKFDDKVREKGFEPCDRREATKKYKVRCSACSRDFIITGTVLGLYESPESYVCNSCCRN